MEEPIQHFVACDDEGKEYRLTVIQEYVSAATRAHPSAVIAGLKRIVTEDAESVNHLDKGEYEVVQTGIRLHSSDPDAP